MGADSKIEWCHNTFNPWWGCVKVSEACRNCYALSTAKRYGHDVWGATARRRFFGPKHWDEPYKWNASAAKRNVRERVFCASMADVFELLPDGHPDAGEMDASRLALWRMIINTPHLDWLLLTKRPENIAKMFEPLGWLDEPRPNVFLGTTAETQADADRRLPESLKVPAAVHFVSVEPMLENMDLTRWLPPDKGGGDRPLDGRRAFWPTVDWVICGAESGHGARPMNEAWVKALRDQCESTDTAFFYKQKLVDRKKVSLPLLDGRQWAEFPEANP